VWDVEFTDKFGAWWETLRVEDQQGLDAAVRVLERRGPGLGRPLSTESLARGTGT
jgi:hypothetical protein